MKTQEFNGGAMPVVNEKWAARVLGMNHNPGKGPDVMDDKKFLEVKFALIKRKRNDKIYPKKSWTTQEHQLEYAEIWAMPGFWLLGFYEIDRPVRKVRTYDQEELEKIVLEREAYVIKWSWMNQYPTHRSVGKTKYSHWDNIFRYPKFKDFPPIIRTLHVEKGLVHLTEGVPDYLFDIN